MSFTAFDAWWWPYLFILLGGWLATDFWRFLGVYLGGRMTEESEVLVLVRCIATGLVAAVIANLIIFPTGMLASTPLFLRIGAAGLGFVAYLASGKKVLVGIAVGEGVLCGSLLWLDMP
ncbi:AzlD domain-containing protein [Chelativorans sp. AA-79]|uniref:AzlD domain-containing protein n=1 Tax=Chelativorans sp. AA-79 TaxID=3028735 RepID=UPI0023F7815B|nr:AzlD domain-containing protein [Chelativorans sp. AA-79]WEX11735.1 AzlD domain-containing protein [Chelativorans sp. AA-79]